MQSIELRRNGTTLQPIKVIANSSFKSKWCSNNVEVVMMLSASEKTFNRTNGITPNAPVAATINVAVTAQMES